VAQSVGCDHVMAQSLECGGSNCGMFCHILRDVVAQSVEFGGSICVLYGC